MCGACPGGAAVPRLTAYANLTGITAEVTTVLQRAAGNRVRVTRFADRWLLRSRTGAQSVAADLEQVAGHLVRHGAVDWAGLGTSTAIGVDVDPDGRTRSCPYDAELRRIESVPARHVRPTLTASQFAVALLVRAGNSAVARKETPAALS
ncbi:hypothetical protein [Prescottella sp. R16]|uniref:hypothetical protein n=1 Tax=Prescottella sp. R16 TaxID=3064529 RepID=UPI00272EA848|nr:hypothetical protein [Prescottella sp. R16]